jgi:hypothetical protein
MLKPRPLLPVTGDVNFRLARFLNIFYWISLFISLTGTILSNGYFIFHSLKKMTEQAHLCLVMSVNKANVLIKRFTNVTICSIQKHFYYTPRKQSLGVHRNHPVRPSVGRSMYLVSATPPKRLMDFYETLHICSTLPAAVHEGIWLLSKI